MHRLPAVLVLVLVAGASAVHHPAAVAAPTGEDYAVVNFFRRMLGIAPAPQVRPSLPRSACLCASG